MAHAGPGADVEGAARYVLDDDLVAAARGGIAGFRAYVPDGVSVVLGRGSRPEVELDREACAADGVPILRRPGGGCAVVLDPGNVIVAAAIPQEGLPRIRELFASFTEWLLGASGGSEWAAFPGRTSPIWCWGIGRSAGLRSTARAARRCCGVSLLVDPRPELMEKIPPAPAAGAGLPAGSAARPFVGAWRTLADGRRRRWPRRSAGPTRSGDRRGREGSHR